MLAGAHGRFRVRLAVGASHSMVLTQDGGVWTTGWNNYGQLGDALTADGIKLRGKFVQVMFGGAKAVAAGDAHSIVLKQDGSVWAAGRNDNGQQLKDNGRRDVRHDPEREDAQLLDRVTAEGVEEPKETLSFSALKELAHLDAIYARESDKYTDAIYREHSDREQDTLLELGNTKHPSEQR